MGLYREHVLPRIIDRTCGNAVTEPSRRRACAGLTGEVVEIGFGSGTNVPFYPPTVSRVLAVEPSDVAWRLAAERVAASPVRVERAGRDAQVLPLADDSVDRALVSWTLCTVPEPVAALAEVRRVVRPGGVLHFVEHGLASDASVRRWQRRIEPIQKRVGGGCHLTREPVAMIETAGFVVREVDHFYEEGAPRSFGAVSLGVAAVSASGGVGPPT